MVFKRKRIYAPKRPFKKRRFVKKRYNKRSHGSNGFTSHAAAPAFITYRGLSNRRIRNWKRGLLKTTQYMPKFLAAGNSTSTITMPASVVNGRMTSFPILTGTGVDFSLPTNWISFNGNVTVPTTVAGKIFCRGGLSELTLVSEATEVLRYRVFLVFTKNQLPTNADVAFSQYPTDGTALNTVVRIIRKYEGFIEPSSAVQFRFRIPPHQIDKEDFDAIRNRWAWNTLIANTVDAAANVCKANYIERVSMCADVVS